MARPGLRNHPKFRRLVMLLDMPAVYVVAHLQAMWDVGYESGNTKLGDVVDVELAGEWIGVKGKFCEALFGCGWIDDIDGVYHIHDLLDHAPEYVQKRAKRELERRNKNLQQKTADNGGQRRTTADKSIQPVKNGGTPSPHPARTQPAPSPALNTPAKENLLAATSPADPPAAPEQQQVLVLKFPLRGGGTWTPTRSVIEQIADAHGEIDVQAELRRAVLWCEFNETRRRPRGEMLNFLQGWMRDALDRQNKTARGQPLSAADAEFEKHLEKVRSGK